MPGEPDPLYIRARSALLDAADALAEHRNAFVLVGAQAVYLHTGEADLHDAADPYTTDADLAISPADLAASPPLGDLMTQRGFTPREHPGSWVSRDGIQAVTRRVDTHGTGGAPPNSLPTAGPYRYSEGKARCAKGALYRRTITSSASPLTGRSLHHSGCGRQALPVSGDHASVRVIGRWWAI